MSSLLYKIVILLAILNIYKGMLLSIGQSLYKRRSTVCMMVSKHLAANAKRYGNDFNDFNEKTIIDPKKEKIIERLDLDNLISKDKMKTGAELRRERKEVLKIQLRNEKSKQLKNKKLASSSSSGSLDNKVKSKAVRFVLGNKIEVLTSSNLLYLVKSTAPYYFPQEEVKLIMDEDDYDNDDDNDDDNINNSNSNAVSLASLAKGPDGWLTILNGPVLSLLPNTDTPTETQRIDYFALCMAAHFATVATYVPTDVDSKIRGHCWHDPSDFVLEKQFLVLKEALLWNVDSVSKRTLKIHPIDPVYPISGHNGEFLGSLVGAWGAFLRKGNKQFADEAEELISKELEREANAFKYMRSTKPGVIADTVLLKLAAIMTHNVGDVDQGYSYWDNEGKGFEEQFQKYSRLAHERNDRYDGEYARAKLIYKELLAAEGHRNYPLREAKALRSTPDLLLPIGPYFEAWGRTIAVHPALSTEDRITIIRQLIRGCDSTSRAWCVPNQIGYYRALNGVASVISLDRLSKDLDKDCNAVLKTHDMRLQLDLSENSFASRLGVRARELLEQSI